jgi:predicted ArsR family transcriptional regulator
MDGSIVGSMYTTTVTSPPANRQPMCDDDLLRLLADQRPRSVAEMAAHFHVTWTAIRCRLVRLMKTHAVVREPVPSQGRHGRPKYLYYLAGSGRDGTSR